MDARRTDSDHYRRLTLVKNFKKKLNQFCCVRFDAKTKRPREQTAYVKYRFCAVPMALFTRRK